MGTRIFVGRVSGSARERDIERFFKGYGRLTEVMMKNGYCFVEFDDPRDADDAIYELNGKEMLGERLIVEPARLSQRGRARVYGGGGGSRYGGGGGGGGGGSYGGRYDDRRGARYGPPMRTDYRLAVENLSSRASWQDLKDHMRQSGEVTFADAHRQRTGEGVVEYATERDMKRALEKLDGSEINGKAIKLRAEKSYRSRKRRLEGEYEHVKEPEETIPMRARPPGPVSSVSTSFLSPLLGRRHASYSRSRSRSRSKSSRSRSRSRSNSRSRSPTPVKKKKRSRSKSESEKEKRRNDDDSD